MPNIRRIYLTVHLEYNEGTASESAAKSLSAPLNDRLAVESLNAVTIRKRVPEEKKKRKRSEGAKFCVSGPPGATPFWD